MVKIFLWISFLLIGRYYLRPGKFTKAGSANILSASGLALFSKPHITIADRPT